MDEKSLIQRILRLTYKESGSCVLICKERAIVEPILMGLNLKWLIMDENNPQNFDIKKVNWLILLDISSSLELQIKPILSKEHPENIILCDSAISSISLRSNQNIIDTLLTLGYRSNDQSNFEPFIWYQKETDNSSQEYEKSLLYFHQLLIKQNKLILDYHKEITVFLSEYASLKNEYDSLKKQWYLFWLRRVVKLIGETKMRIIKSISKYFNSIRRGIEIAKIYGLKRMFIVGIRRVIRFTKKKIAKLKLRFGVLRFDGQVCEIENVIEHRKFLVHNQAVDIVICVHNALDDIKKCLQSLLINTTEPYNIILVDDGSDIETSSFLEEFSIKTSNCMLLRNESAQGYTFAANKGIKASKADYVVLLNSDTIVTRGWIEGLITCAESEEQIGIVGPLSNTASWQSIPNFEENGDWAKNQLPEGVSLEQYAKWINENSTRLYPEMPFLNGFCLLIKRKVIEEIGLFDEDNFGPGYGEEDDFILRARKRGWKAALADDTYIYHAQSKSYSNERRKTLSALAGKKLINKHGEELILNGIDYCLNSLVLEGIRARAKVLPERMYYLELGKKYAGRKILFLLPVSSPGGGANVIVTESMALKKMGVEVEFFNLPVYRSEFLRSYPGLKIPVHFLELSNLLQISQEFDAIIATHNQTVSWLTPIIQEYPDIKVGYYIQDFEPLMYPAGSEEYKIAWNSYNLFPNLIRFTKTDWTSNEIKRNIGVNSSLVGISFDINLFCPRPNKFRESNNRPLRIAAMIRPESPYRNPGETMSLLKKASRKYGGLIETVIFGTTLDNPEFHKFELDFPWKLYGVLPNSKVANLLNSVDIFVDYSSHQAMGLTALEAMACGCAVIVPENGGATSFCHHLVNGMVADTSSFNAVFQNLQKLIENDTLRSKIQKQAVYDTCNYFPEKSAYRILEVIFGE